MFAQAKAIGITFDKALRELGWHQFQLVHMSGKLAAYNANLAGRQAAGAPKYGATVATLESIL